MTEPAPGRPETLAKGVRRILAPNPGPMTHWGTNTYLLGESKIAVIDPGPESHPHLKAILAATEGQTISHILVTHAHADHSPLSRALAKATGAPIYGFGGPDAGRSATMQQLAEAGLAGGGEGVDHLFRPDVEFREGDELTTEDWRITALHTPGHFAGHLAFRCGSHLFSGDHVMDWSSSLVSPPDGDIGAFMESSERLKALKDVTFLPGHGQPIHQAAQRLDWLIGHRRARETAILDALGNGPLMIEALTARVYTDTPQKMLAAAARNVFAHLIDLVERNIVQANPSLSVSAAFEIV